MSPFSEFVTPARRQREEDESDFDVSVDGEGSERSNASKRPRLDANDSDDEVSEVLRIAQRSPVWLLYTD